MARARVIALGFEPFASRLRRACQFKQQRKLSRIGVLRFIQDDAERLFPDFTPDLWMLRYLKRQLDLIVVGQKAALNSKRAIIALHLCCHAKGGLVDPPAERRE